MKPGRLALLASLAAACMLPFAADSIARPRPAPPPPPPDYDALPQVYLSPSLVQQAAAYRAYINRASSINAGFQNPASVSVAMTTGAAYEPRQFLRGALAYAAIAALQDAEFVAAVRAQGPTLAARNALEYQILADPAFIMRFPHAPEAAALSMAALHGEGLRLYSNGRLVKQAAYDTQHQPWANTRSTSGEAAAQLASVRILSATPLTADIVEADRLNRSVSGQPLGLAPDPDAHAPYTPLVARAVSLAALAAIGMAGDDRVSRIMPNLTDPEATFCLNIARLNLYQCLAVAGPHYEDMFCLGQHVLMDTGACLIRGSGAGMPLDVRPPPLPVPGVAAAAAAGPARAARRGH